jgi:hypothetical protein
VRLRGMCTSAWTLGCIRADAIMRPHGRKCASSRTLVFTPCNFKKDATVRPSHGRPHGHRPTVRPSENVRVTTLPTGPYYGLGLISFGVALASAMSYAIFDVVGGSGTCV